MPIIGNDAAPSFSYHAYAGTGYPNQEAEDIALPAQRIRITRLGVYVGGWNDAPRVRLCIWSASGVLVAQSAEFVVANEGAEGEGNYKRYEANLITPYETPAPSLTVRVGFTRNRDDKHQVGVGASTPGGHYHGRAGYPAGAFAEIDGGYAEGRRIGCWIQDYEPLANAYVLRGATWTRITPAAYRGGVWKDAEAVAGLRAGTWKDAD